MKRAKLGDCCDGMRMTIERSHPAPVRERTSSGWPRSPDLAQNGKA